MTKLRVVKQKITTKAPIEVLILVNLIRALPLLLIYLVISWVLKCNAINDVTKIEQSCGIVYDIRHVKNGYSIRVEFSTKNGKIVRSKFHSKGGRLRIGSRVLINYLKSDPDWIALSKEKDETCQ